MEAKRPVQQLYRIRRAGRVGSPALITPKTALIGQLPLCSATLSHRPDKRQNRSREKTG
jgi:hypothetical protein